MFYHSAGLVIIIAWGGYDNAVAQCPSMSSTNLDLRSPSRDDNRGGNVCCGCCPGHGLTVVTRGVSHDHPGLLASLHQAQDTIEGSYQKYFSSTSSTMTSYGIERKGLIDKVIMITTNDKWHLNPDPTH